METCVFMKISKMYQT